MRYSACAFLAAALFLLPVADVYAHGDEHHRRLTRGERACVATLANVTCGKLFSCGTPNAGVTFAKCERSIASKTRETLRERSARRGLAQCTNAVTRVTGLSCADLRNGGTGTKR